MSHALLQPSCRQQSPTKTAHDKIHCSRNYQFRLALEGNVSKYTTSHCLLLAALDSCCWPCPLKLFQLQLSLSTGFLHWFTLTRINILFEYHGQPKPLWEVSSSMTPHVKITFSLLNIWLIFIQPRKEGSFAFECQLTCPHVCIISIYLLDIAAWGFHLERYLQPCQILPDSALVSTRFNPRLALVRPSNLLVSKIWHFSMSWWQKWPLYLTLFMFLAQKQLHSSQNSSNRALLTVNAPANTALLISLALLFTVSSSTEISGRTTP